MATSDQLVASINAVAQAITNSPNYTSTLAGINSNLSNINQNVDALNTNSLELRNSINELKVQVEGCKNTLANHTPPLQEAAVKLGEIEVAAAASASNIEKIHQEYSVEQNFGHSLLKILVKIGEGIKRVEMSGVTQAKQIEQLSKIVKKAFIAPINPLLILGPADESQEIAEDGTPIS